MQYARGFKAKANRIAVNVRGNLGLLPRDPLCPWKLCDHFEIKVVRLSAMVDESGEQIGKYLLLNERSSFSAMTVPRGIRRAIVHNDKHAPVRQRSNLMHEVAHSLLGHVATPLLTGNGERAFDQLIEAEAHFLAGCLLIPNEAAHHIVVSGLQTAAPGVYGVSRSMLTYRLRISGALKRGSRLTRLVATHH